MSINKRIVIIERDPEWRHYVAGILSEAGYDVQIILRGMSIDLQQALYLVDGSMGDYIDQLVRQRRQFVVFDSAPTIPKAIRAYRVGALDYLGKTFEAEALLRAVAAAKDKESVRLKLVPPVQNGNHAPPLMQ